MIEVNKGQVILNGNPVVIMAEATVALDKVSYMIHRETGIPQKDALKQIYKTVKEGLENDDSND